MISPLTNTGYGIPLVMPDKSYSLFVSDLDATLLNSAGQLSDFARKHLTDLVAGGLPLSFASARSQYSMHILLDGLPATLPVIEFNGACVTEWGTGHHLHTIAIDKSETHPLYEKGQHLGLPPFITTVDGDNDWLYWPEPVNPEIQWLLDDRRRLRDARLRQTSKMTHDFLDEEVICMTFVGYIEEIRQMREWIDTHIANDVVVHCYENSYHLGWYWLTVHPRNASKGAALQWLANHLDVPLSDICVFGDNDNDISMFKEAGYAIAVENAVDSVKELADEIIGPHTDDAVVEYLLKLSN